MIQLNATVVRALFVLLLLSGLAVAVLGQLDDAPHGLAALRLQQAEEIDDLAGCQQMIAQARVHIETSHRLSERSMWVGVVIAILAGLGCAGKRRA
ncbi:MAG: hypothetical protein KDA60_03105 [Planctomycetales bacterium]|nr:hypothetical protein [Planctomycetales bacterium]